MKQEENSLGVQWHLHFKAREEEGGRAPRPRLTNTFTFRLTDVSQRSELEVGGGGSMLVHRHQWFVVGVAFVGIYLAFAENDQDVGVGSGKRHNWWKGTPLKRVYIKVRSRVQVQGGPSPCRGCTIDPGQQRVVLGWCSKLVCCWSLVLFRFLSGTFGMPETGLQCNSGNLPTKQLVFCGSTIGNCNGKSLNAI